MARGKSHSSLNNAKNPHSLGRGAVSVPKTMSKGRGNVHHVRGTKTLRAGGKSHGRNY